MIRPSPWGSSWFANPEFSPLNSHIFYLKKKKSQRHCLHKTTENAKNYEGAVNAQETRRNKAFGI